MGVRSINQCVCGELYTIGDCGKPMDIGRCSSCRRSIGGTNHQYVNGQNQGVSVIEQQGNLAIAGITDAGRSDIVRGLDINWFQEGQDYRERELEPLEYRVLCLLLLIPLAVFSPRTERRAQLGKHWNAFRVVSGSASDTDAQHLLLGILVRLAQHKPDLIGSLAMAKFNFTRPQERADAENSFRIALREVINGDTPNQIVSEVQTRINDTDSVRQVLLL